MQSVDSLESTKYKLCKLCKLVYAVVGLCEVQDLYSGCNHVRLEYQLIHGAIATLYSLGAVGTRSSLGAPIGYLL